jgi:hypothetical protein
MTPQQLQEKLLLALEEKNKILKLLCKSRTREICEAKELLLLEVSEAESQVIEQQSLMKVVADAAYDLIRRFVCGKAQTQWDHIDKDFHEKDPWMGINWVKTKGLHSWNCVSLKDCIDLHKLMVFTYHVAEKQASDMMTSLKKPIKMTIHQHTMRMEVLNGYLMHLPCRAHGNNLYGYGG